MAAACDMRAGFPHRWRRVRRRGDILRSLSGALIAALGFTTLIAGLPACGPERDSPTPPIILISIDTCRADHVGCYGTGPSATPNLDRLAAHALRFTHVLSPVPMTLPSHCSMFTGMTPLGHGVHDNLTYRLDDGCLTLPEILRKHGYRTAGITGAFVLDARFGIGQGFEHYDDRIDTGTGGSTRLNERKAQEVTRLALQWIEQAPRGRFFLFLHYYDPHAPYEPPQSFAASFASDPYRGEIAYVDDCLGQLFAKLDALDLYKRSLILVTSDHGEGLGEHGESGHGYYIYQSTLHVPLIIKLPGRTEARVVDEPAGLIDLAPTILGQVGLALPAAMTGRDLLDGGTRAREAKQPSAPRPDAQRALYCESLTPTKHGCAPLLGVVRGELKYIQTTRPELYDLARDPRESRDLITERARQANELRAGLETWLAQAAGPELPGRRAAPDEEMRARLQSLGYIAGRAVDEALVFDASRPDPKDRIQLHERFELILDRLDARRFAEAEALCRTVLAEQEDVAAAWILLGDIAYESGRLEDAVAHYEAFLSASARESSRGASEAEVLALSPDVVRAHYDLANALAGLGRREEALTHYREALELTPDHLEAHYNLGLTLAELGRIAEAGAEFEAVLAMQTDFMPAYLDLAEVRRMQGRPADGVACLDQALRIRPDYAEALLRLGDLHAATGEIAQARDAYAEARRLHPELPEAHVKLAQALMRLGQRDEARQVMDEALRAFPQLRQPSSDANGASGP
jgi:arylsulfatase A-like enzyme/Tfp pilus assembly protein PilF